MDVDDRVQVAELRTLLNDWDPLGVRGDNAGPADEYDCLIWGLLGQLQRGAAAYAIASYLQKELIEHYGVTGAYHPMHFAERLVEWYRTRAHPR
jgi:hypothetical protein